MRINDSRDVRVVQVYSFTLNTAGLDAQILFAAFIQFNLTACLHRHT